MTIAEQLETPKSRKKTAASAATRLPPISPEWRSIFQRLEVPQADWRKPPGLTVAFAHSLVVPAGKFVNRPLRLRPFQMKFIRDVYNTVNEHGRRRCRQAVLSIARRGGKTLLAALIILAHLAGPVKRPNSTIVSAATTRKQASIVFRMCALMVQKNPMLENRRLKVLDATKRIVHKGDGSNYAAIWAEAGGQYGEGLDLVVYDGHALPWFGFDTIGFSGAISNKPGMFDKTCSLAVP